MLAGTGSLEDQTILTQEDLVDVDSGDLPCTSKQPGLEQNRARELGRTAGEGRDGRLKYSRPPYHCRLAIL
ncbi:hypothetical protein E2C01_094985 [Portunus trituberculatus]|uniref:Uncharacterized protein n=1 Tax=Portunus trituberculatus TaxID=210409 RepID=A0A5B7JYN5_PORTR|nr:hypothetical protein [Portunus trituberculatus]